MRRLRLVFIFIAFLTPLYNLSGQVVEKPVQRKDTISFRRDSVLHLLRLKDSLLNQKKKDSVKMAGMISRLEFYRDSLNAALNQSIYEQKLDSAERMRKFLATRDFNRKSRIEFYAPIGVIDNDSLRSSMKKVVDFVFEDTAYHAKQYALRASMENLVHHLGNDSIYFRIVNAGQDTIPFVMKRNYIDSTAFFVMNSKQDSAKVYMRSLDKNTVYMYVGDDLMLRQLLKKQGPPDAVTVKWDSRDKFRVTHRQVPVLPASPWSLRAEPSLLLNQASFVNWAKGGTNNITFTTDVKAYAHYAKGSIKWDNSFWFVYGLQKTDLLSLHKSQDKINIVSNLSHKALKKLDYTFGTTFDTQGFRGYANPNDSVPVSTFMAPADLKLTLGVTYKPLPNFSMNISPAGGLMRFVLDTALIDQTRYGVAKDKRMMGQLTGSVVINHSILLFKNLQVNNYLNLSSYYFNQPGKINFDWRLAVSLKFNKFISMAFNTEMLYDHTIDVPIYKIVDGAKKLVGKDKRVQFYEVMGVSFKYIITSTNINR